MKLLHLTTAASLAAALLPPASMAQAAGSQLGKKVFANCAACHSLKPGENSLGPSLAGIIGRGAGQAPGFRYSNAIKRSGAAWDAATLDRFLHDPQAFAPGNRMPYSGLQDAQERQALIEYLAHPD